MKAGIIILCRYSSSRLPGKIMKEIEGKPILQYITESSQCISTASEVIIATSTDPSDDPIAAYCQVHNLSCYRGSLEDVLERFVQAALHFRLDYAVRINGDNLFLDHRLADEMINLALSHPFDLVTNVPGRTFPTGMSIEVLSVPFLASQNKNITSAYYREHVTLYFYENAENFRIFVVENTQCPEAKGMQLAIDTQKDFELAKYIITQMDKPHHHYGLPDIYRLAQKRKDHG